MMLLGPDGGITPPKADQGRRASSRAGSGTCWAQVGSMVCTVGPVACRDERNADGARTATLLTPIPPHLTGNDAWTQDSVSSFRLHRDESATLMTSSS